jgi:hypothetical protein
MAETDILNPTRGWWRDINDNPNPSYGYTRRSQNNSALARVRLGAPYSREVMNQGHAFEFNYIDRPWTTILRLKRFYEQHKGGYFTYIDWDGGGRHHVGRFTTPVNHMQTGNDKYTVQGLVFEEIPQARMVSYPADFVNWSRQINVLDDALNAAVSTFSVNPGAWIAQIDPSLYPVPSATAPSGYELFNPAPTLSTVSPASFDFAQIQYVGWGFQIKFRAARGLGQVAIFIDGVYLTGVFDLSSGARVADGSGFLPPLPAGATYENGVLTVTQMPLDIHRIKIVPYAAGSNGSLVMASGSVTFTSARPLGVTRQFVTWSNFSLISTPLPSDAAIQQIIPVIIAGSNNPDTLFTTLGYGSSGSAPFTTPSNTLVPTDDVIFPITEFSAPSIGTALSALTGQEITAEYDDSLFQDGLSDAITVTGVGFAILYTSATPSIDTCMPAPVAVPAGQGLTWALPASVTGSGTDAQGTGNGTVAHTSPTSIGAIFPRIKVIV